MTSFKTITIGEHKELIHLGSPAERVRFRVQTGAHLRYFLPVLSENSSETHVVVELEGTNSRVDSQVIFFGHKKQEQKLHVEHVHLGRNTISRLVARGAVKDRAKSHFYGSIRMKPGSRGAQGELQEHSLLLSSEARVEAIPALEIEHDDVQASHAATLEKVDAERLFYLLSRGLTSREAMELLVEGFFKDALASMPEEYRDPLYRAILKKL